VEGGGAAVAAQQLAAAAAQPALLVVALLRVGRAAVAWRSAPPAGGVTGRPRQPDAARGAAHARSQSQRRVHALHDSNHHTRHANPVGLRKHPRL